MIRIASRQNPRFREVARLVASSRERRKTRRAILEGGHVVAEYLARFGAPEVLVLNEDAAHRPGIAALVAGVPAASVLLLSRALFDGLGALPPEVGVIAIAPAPSPPAGTAAGGSFLFLAEAIQDPGNLGSMLRSAAAFGVDAVHLSSDCAFPWSPKVLRAGQGAHFRLAIHEDADLVAAARAFRAAGGRVLAAVAAGGIPLPGVRTNGRVAVAVGNEGAGLSAALRAEADEAVTIPMPGGTESLNAAAAAAVMLYEVARSRVTPG